MSLEMVRSSYSNLVIFILLLLNLVILFHFTFNKDTSYIYETLTNSLKLLEADDSNLIISVFSRVYLEELYPELKKCKVSIESEEQQQALFKNVIVINNATILNDVLNSKSKNNIIFLPAYDDKLHYPIYQGYKLNIYRWGHGQECHRGDKLISIINNMNVTNKNIKFCIWAYSVGNDTDSGWKTMALTNKTWYQGEDIIFLLRNAMQSTFRKGVDISYPPSLVNTGDFDVRNLSKDNLMNIKNTFAYFRGKGNSERYAVKRVFKQNEDTNSKIILFGGKRFGGKGYNMMEEMSESIFSLIIRGDNAYTMRYTQAICCGSIPVNIKKDWIPPFDELISFETYGIIHDAQDIDTLYQHLKSIKNDTIKQLRYASYDICLNHYRTPAKIIQTVLQILKKRYQSIDRFIESD